MINIILAILFFCNSSFAVGFATLKKNDVNVRNGPGKEYGILYKFTRVGMPVHIIHKLDNWYLIKDFENDTGWIKSNMLSFNKKNGLVIENNVPVCRLPTFGTEKCSKIAILKYLVITQIKYCGKKWCRIKIDQSSSGWVEKNKLWGIL